MGPIEDPINGRQRKAERGLERERALRLRVLVALPEVLRSVPNTHMAAHNCL